MSAEGTPFQVEASLNGAADAYSGIPGERVDVSAGVAERNGALFSAMRFPWAGDKSASLQVGVC
jgi:hypothetical protein